VSSLPSTRPSARWISVQSSDMAVLERNDEG
jgi:hypothetical protein